MTFLKIQNMLKQTKKARDGIKNRRDYFDDYDEERFYVEVYRKALSAANKIVKFYFDKRVFDKRDKIVVEIKAHKD